jgi:hypothetical protein
MGNLAHMKRERRTVAAMVQLYCRDQHATQGALCDDCQKLLEYAMLRLDRCVFASNKPTCARCPVHCYKPVFRDRIREVMRYAGPRMLLRHPALAVAHLLDRRRPVRLRKSE